MKKQYTNFKIAEYAPLLTLVCIAALAAVAICYGLRTTPTSMHWMHYFMGLLFCLFALVKLFNLQGFADGFQMYDLIAKKSRPYALCYPFIELILGLMYLSFLYPLVTYFLTIAFMSVGVVGVIKALKENLNVYCACMGSVLKVPLSTVTLVEDIVMGLMALVLIYELIF